MKQFREYRGKSIFTGKWIYGSLIRRGEDVFIMPPDWSIDMADAQVNPETVGQLIGLQDKNGVDIYEGDIVAYDVERSDYSPATFHSPEIPETKRWIETEKRTVSLCPEIRLGHELIVTSVGWEYSKKIAVIGNNYDETL